jgi:uncharacterized coiled-coil protein SlyX
MIDSSNDLHAKSACAQALGAILYNTDLLPDDVLDRSLRVVVEMNQNSDKALVARSMEPLGAIIAKALRTNEALVQLAIERLFRLCSNEEMGFNAGALDTLTKIIGSTPHDKLPTDFIKRVFDIVVAFSAKSVEQIENIDRDTYMGLIMSGLNGHQQIEKYLASELRTVAVRALYNVLKARAHLTSDIVRASFGILEKMCDDVSPEVRAESENTISELLKLNETDEHTILLEHGNDKVQEIALTALLDTIDTKTQQLDAIGAIKFCLSTASRLGSVRSVNAHYQKELLKKIDTILDKQTKNMKDSDVVARAIGDTEMLELGMTSSQGKKTCAAILHTVLLARKITDETKAFVSKCIEYGFTLSLTRDGSITFEGIKYDSNGGSIDSVFQDELVHVQQHVKHQSEQLPSFKRSTHSGLKAAANDVEDVCSIVVPTHVVSKDKWHISLFKPSVTSHQAVFKTFVVLETRNCFGDRVVYKVTDDGIIPLLKPEETHPHHLVTRPTRESLFGKLVPQHLEYVVSSIQIPVNTASSGMQGAATSAYSRSTLEVIKQALSHGLTVGFQQLKDISGAEIITPDSITVSMRTLLNIDSHSLEGRMCDLERGQLETQTTLSVLKVVAAQYREDIDLLSQDIRILSTRFTNHDSERKVWEDNINTEVTKLMQDSGITKGKILKLCQDIKADAERLTAHLQDHPLPSTAAQAASAANDNLLVKYPALFAKAIEKFGATKTLHLSSKLSQPFLEEAVRNNDPEILLVGLMSLMERSDAIQP